MSKQAFNRLIVNSKDLTNYVQRMHFTRSVEMDNLCEIDLAFEHKGQIDYLLNQKIIREGYDCEFRYGYKGYSASPVYKGVLIDYYPVFSDIETLHITISDYGHEAARESRDKVWSGEGGVTYRSVVESIASRYGIKLISVIEGMDDVLKEDLPQANETDMDFLQKIATKLGGECRVSGKDIIFFDRDLSKDPILRFKKYDQRIQSFEPRHAATDNDESATAVTVVDVDPFEGEVVQETSRQDSSDKSTAGEFIQLYDVDGNESEMPGRVLPIPVKSNREARLVADKERTKSKLRNIEATLTTDGIVEAEEDEMITILGYPEMYNGNYYVLKVEDDIDGGAFTTTFTIQKDGTKVPTATTGEKSSKVNNTSGPEKAVVKKSIQFYDVNGNEIE